MGLLLKKANQTMTYVPFKKHNNLFCFIPQLLTLILTLGTLVKCESLIFDGPLTSQYFDDYYTDNYREDFINNDIPLKHDPTTLSSQPTPPLDPIWNLREGNSEQSANNDRSPIGVHNAFKRNIISPAKVRLARQENFFSPIFNSQLINQNIFGNNDIYKAAQTSSPQHVPPPDTSNNFDLIEPGSGSDWGLDNNQPFDDTTNIMEDSTIASGFDSTPTAIMPTPMMTPNFDQFATSSVDVGDGYNRAPILNRRLPKLSIVAGQFWKYFIPFDTFIDEDGDLRQLKSAILSKKLLSPDNSNKISMTFEDDRLAIGQYFSWLQYNQPSQLLYGLPTENDAGLQKLMLVVSDHWGATSDETIEINIKQHQSIRAFTHLFIINGIECNRQRFTSMVDAIGEFIKRISTRVYFDEPLKNVVVQSYTIINQETSSNNQTLEGREKLDILNEKSSVMSFTLGWSNSSIPVHPCNISQLDNLFKMLIDTRELDVDWSLERGTKTELPPSPNLIRALGSDFKISSISVILQGSCEGKGFNQNNNIQSTNSSDTIARVNVKIGKLTWKLGEPIEYQIPVDTFASEKGTSITRDLQLSLHTIDGLMLNNDPRYNFLEFDQDSQTLFGLSYNQDDHSGQREILLTARNPINGHKIREVFIINIEPQDLTTINNRAFKVSLYLFTRSGLFGPRERVALSHKMAGALRDGRLNFNHDKENPEMVIIDLQKFALKGLYTNNSAALSDMDSYLDKIIKVVDINNNHVDEQQLVVDGIGQNIFLYKYTWTNATIGYRGDCPVEVIKENVLFALEQSMLELRIPDNIFLDDTTKNDSARFYHRLRLYFEPEFDLIHLRFEPIGACASVLELHDVGNGDVADQADRAGEAPFEPLLEVTTPQTLPITPKVEVETNNDEYWSIIVLIILVMALIFVIIMFFMGMHTYKINQDKRFELQVKLAQARQNSMYLSSMILANQATPSDMCGPMIAQGLPKSMYVVQEEEKGSRKPMILDNEKQLLTGNQLGPVNLQPTTVQLSGQTVHTMIANWQPTMTQSPSRMMQNYMNERQRSMTLNHRSSNSSIQHLSRQQTSINHSQSILTVASLSGPLPMIPQGRLPVVYAQVPLMNGGVELNPQQNYSSLQRSYSQQRASDISMANRMSQMRQASYVAPNDSFDDQSLQAKNYASKLQPNGTIVGNSTHNKIRSPSYSSSNSATTQSVISNPNYLQTN